jgi:TRAP-type C4-dicarboxylate transport system substrate-binding protein
VQFKKWLVGILSEKLSDELRDKVKEAISEAEQEEVDGMVSNVSLIIGRELKKSKMEGKHEKSVEVARNAILKGAKLEFIAEITGLGIDKVREIYEECKM